MLLREKVRSTINHLKKPDTESKTIGLFLARSLVGDLLEQEEEDVSLDPALEGANRDYLSALMRDFVQAMGGDFISRALAGKGENALELRKTVLKVLEISSELNILTHPFIAQFIPSMGSVLREEKLDESTASSCLNCLLLLRRGGSVPATPYFWGDVWPVLVEHIAQPPPAWDSPETKNLALQLTLTNQEAAADPGDLLKLMKSVRNSDDGGDVDGRLQVLASVLQNVPRDAIITAEVYQEARANFVALVSNQSTPESTRDLLWLECISMCQRGCEWMLEDTGELKSSSKGQGFFFLFFARMVITEVKVLQLELSSILDESDAQQVRRNRSLQVRCMLSDLVLFLLDCMRSADISDEDFWGEGGYHPLYASLTLVNDEYLLEVMGLLLEYCTGAIDFLNEITGLILVDLDREAANFLLEISPDATEKEQPLSSNCSATSVLFASMQYVACEVCRCLEAFGDPADEVRRRMKEVIPTLVKICGPQCAQLPRAGVFALLDFISKEDPSSLMVMAHEGLTAGALDFIKFSIETPATNCATTFSAEEMMAACELLASVILQCRRGEDADKLPHLGATVDLPGIDFASISLTSLARFATELVKGESLHSWPNVVCSLVRLVVAIAATGESFLSSEEDLDRAWVRIRGCILASAKRGSFLKWNLIAQIVREADEKSQNVSSIPPEIKKLILSLSL